MLVTQLYSFLSRLKSTQSSRPSITEANEADLGNSKTHALFSEDVYAYCPNKEDSYKTKSPQGNAVKVWLYHNHFL